MAKRDETRLRKLNASYRQLQTAAQDNRAMALIEAAAKTQYQRDEFAREVWEAVRDGVRISHITESTGAARTTIYKALKEFKDNNKDLATTMYTFTNPSAGKYLIHGSTWVQGLKFEYGLGKLTGTEVGNEEDFRRELDDESTGLRERIAAYVNELRAAGAEQDNEREDLDD